MPAMPAFGKMATLAETRTIKGEIARLAEFFASFKREPGNATPEQIQSMEDVAKAFHENRGELDINRALERLAAQERVSGIEAAALARAEEEMGNRVVSPQTLKEAGQRRFDEARMDQQDWLGGERERTKTLSDPQASQWGVEKSRPF